MAAFRIFTILIGLVPLFLGATGVLFGASEHNGGEAVSAALDSQYRYLAAVYVAVGAMILGITLILLVQLRWVLVMFLQVMLLMLLMPQVLQQLV